MKLLNNKTTYEVSLIEIKLMIAKELGIQMNEADSRIQLNPQYGWSDYDGPGHSHREVTGFEVVVTKD